MRTRVSNLIELITLYSNGDDITTDGNRVYIDGEYIAKYETDEDAEFYAERMRNAIKYGNISGYVTTMAVK